MRFGHSVALLTGGGQEADDAWLGQTADSPCPDRADTLEVVRGWVRNDKCQGCITSFSISPTSNSSLFTSTINCIRDNCDEEISLFFKTSGLEKK